MSRQASQLPLLRHKRLHISCHAAVTLTMSMPEWQRQELRVRWPPQHSSCNCLHWLLCLWCVHSFSCLRAASILVDCYASPAGPLTSTSKAIGSLLVLESLPLSLCSPCGVHPTVYVHCAPARSAACPFMSFLSRLRNSSSSSSSPLAHSSCHLCLFLSLFTVSLCLMVGAKALL